MKIKNCCLCDSDYDPSSSNSTLDFSIKSGSLESENSNESNEENMVTLAPMIFFDSRSKDSVFFKRKTVISRENES